MFSQFSGLEVNASKNSTNFNKIYEENTDLHNILGYIVKKLPITYLGLLISGKKSFNECCKLIQPIENHLARWSGKCLFYGARIQLVNWIKAGKYTYWAQDITTPSFIVKNVRKHVYQFIWDGKKSIPWDQMNLHKVEGGLGSGDLPTITRAVKPKGQPNSMTEWFHPLSMGPKEIYKIEVTPCQTIKNYHSLLETPPLWQRGYKHIPWLWG